MSHIRITGTKGDLALSPDFSIDWEDVNPLFNDDVQSGSYQINVPLDGNRHRFRNIDDIHSVLRAIDFEHEPMQIYIDGIPVRSGELIVSEDQQLSDNFDATIQSYTRSLDELISDLECQDIPVKDQIKIGECIGDVTPDYTYYVYGVISYIVDTGQYGTRVDFMYTTDMPSQSSGNIIQLPATGFSVPYDVDRRGNFTSVINTSDPYPDKPYCNVRIAYPHYKLDDEGKTSSDIDKNDPLMVLEANRPGSGICFYVLYFLDCLFRHLGVAYTNTNLLTVEDMKRLAFYTTKCSYDTERNPDTQLSDYDFFGIQQINDHLDWWDEHTPSNIKTGHVVTSEQSSATITQSQKSRKRLVFTPAITGYTGEPVEAEVGKEMRVVVGTYPNQTVYEGLVSKIQMAVRSVSGQTMARHMNMYANSKNFPNKSVKSVIDSLFNSFGIRFVLDYERRSVTPVFIRDIFRNTASPRKLRGKVLSITPMAEKITGVRMRYAAESDPKDQSRNVRDGVRDYDTAYDYLMSASPIIDDYTYQYIITTAGVSNTNCYVDKTTGYAYRWKVDGDATRMSDLNARLFEVASFKGVELGDCSKKNEDYIIDLTSDFEPLVLCDANYLDEKDGATDTTLVPFADVDMKNEQEHCRLTYALGTSMVDFPFTVEIRTDESYDPSSTAEGDSPLQSYDWGMSVGIMRGGGSDAEIQLYDYNYDGFGNQKYRMVSGSYAFTTDTIDQYGNVYDYNGSIGGIGGGERFSLKIRGYHNDPATGNPLFTGGADLQNRGLFDTFMSEYSHFLLHRKKYIIRILCEVAELADIPNHWGDRWQIHDLVGWINRVKTHATNEFGLDDVELEFYSM